ncbi:hypothetical protein K490DRAFT_37376 [Saccharata proteae CBS 121410]|uniref:Uncharacterized protein n=1 Tax=Saccharata proteae CBS 121410 TaxID=1314787 RepID=A0A6A5YC62_9PEZI|nr:hypothetical protein K490DRAFT_37376 [Saccharata proteae CBS 121410]
MATAAMDTAYISKSYNVPQATIETLLDAPTTELVHQLLAALSVKAQEHEDLKNELFRLDTELQTAVRNGDTKARALKDTVDKGLKDLEALRKRLHDEENTRTALESELQNIKSSTSTSSSEAEVLRTRINTLEASNRETLALLEAKSTSYDRLAEELSSQQQKINALRREVTELEEKNQNAQNASTSTRFRQQALEQEVDLLKRNNESYEAEIRSKNDAYSKFRKEKSARISELQRKYDDANETIESLRRTETTLRSRLGEVNQKAEDAFVKIQQLQEAAVRTEESFRVELDSQKRLAELQKESATTARSRLQAVQESMEKIKEDAAEEIGTLQAEVETERREKDAAQARLSELESEVERLEADLAAKPATFGVTGTPRRVNGLAGASTPGRSGSPGAFSPNASRVRGPTMTQLYSEHAQLKSDLDAERRRNEKLSSTIDEMIQELEAKQPEIDELRTGHSRLEAEVLEISELLEESNRSRDTAKKEARKWSGEVNGLKRENDILKQQLGDLSKQVQGLLFEVQVRNEGLESFSKADQVLFEKARAGEVDVEEAQGDSDTARLISQRFVVFTNVVGLQQQNEKLLRIVRELGDRMEGEEARAKQDQQEKDLQELEELRRKTSRFEDELKTLNTVSESYQRERDMFRRMLTHRGQIPPGSDIASIFGQSVDGRVSITPRPPTFSQSVGETDKSKDLSDYARLLKELQSHFDVYRKEAATDHSMLKEQSDRLAREKSEIQIEINRVNSQLALAHERHELLQANYSQLRSENTELQKRSQSLAEISAQQDLKTARAAEDLLDAKVEVDGLRRETANLKAEKELWRNIESRLTDDARALIDERARLNKMITDLQNLQNERELTDAENRRRLQNRIESLESELSSLKRKLDNEVEDGKRAALRREYESEQNRTRIDDLVKSLSNTREELVAAKTQRDQLQARLDEMKIELQNAEERAQALQPKSTSRRDVTNTGEGTATDNPRDLSREQELAVEVADLKRDLELAQRELADAKKDSETYSKISQDAEEALSNANDIHDQYRADMDQIDAEKDAKIRDLEQRVEDISSELATTNTELSQLRTGHEENLSRFNEQKAILETELSRLKDESERYQETAKLCKEDLKAQAEIAQQAQQSYENELIRHAEASQNLQKERSEHAKIKTEVSKAKAEAEAAKKALMSSEDSWTETRSRYEQEITDLKQRREDINNQNKILHQQLEAVSAQIAALKQNRASLSGEGDTNGTPPPGSDNLQEVIRYLRREKEIVDVQYELSIQEAKRLRQQLDHTRSELEQVRDKLNQERQSQIDKEQSAITHSKLIETINELNLFRESSTTLRTEARQAQAQLAEKVREVERLVATIEPLQTKLRDAENDLETKDGELRLLQEDRDRWQQRTQNILQKYDRVDPEELAQLKNRIETLQSDYDEALAAKAPLQQQIDGFSAQLEEAVKEGKAELRNRLQEQFKARSRELSAQMREKDAARETAIQEKDQLLQQLGALQIEFDGLKQDATEEGQIDQDGAASVSREEAEAERASAISNQSKADHESARADQLQQQVEMLQGRIAELEGQLDEHDKALEQLKAKHEAAIEQIKTDHEAEVKRIKTEHAQEIERIKLEHTGLPSDLSDAEARELVSTNPTIKGIVARNIKNRLAQQIEEQSAKDKELFEKQLAEKLEEVKMKAEAAKTNAVTMMEKRQALKVNMAQNKEKQAQAKLEVVEKAAEETPQRPVGEVWAIAKETKPSPAAASATAAAATPNTAAATNSTQRSPAQVTPLVQPNTHPTLVFGHAAGTSQPTQNQHQIQSPVAAPLNQFQSQQGQPPANPFAPMSPQGANPFSQSQQAPQPLGNGAMGNHFRPHPSFGGPANRTNSPFGQSVGGFGPPAQQPDLGATTTQAPPQTMGTVQNQAHSRPSMNVGTGPAVLQNIVRGGGTSLPVPRGGGIPRPSGRGGNQQQGGQQQSQLPRGGGHARGRGRGGRGGNQQLDPVAQQFTPGPQGQQQQGGGRGGKRPHPDGGESGAGKRSRVSE